MASVCGKNETSADGKTVEEYLSLTGYDRTKIAVMINDEIVKKEHFDKTVISPCDCVEIVELMGGG